MYADPRMTILSKSLILRPRHDQSTRDILRRRKIRSRKGLLETKIPIDSEDDTKIVKRSKKNEKNQS